MNRKTRKKSPKTKKSFNSETSALFSSHFFLRGYSKSKSNMDMDGATHQFKQLKQF